MTLTFGSLFSGVGGIDLGLERAGLTCAWQVEKDPACLRVLERHWPNVRRFDDVLKLRAYCEPKNDRRPLPWVVRPDLLCGGFPCQDLSVAGRRAGLAGGRSGLWFVFRRIVALLRPRWVLVENVPGLLSSNGGRDMGAILGALGQLGYGWAYRCLDAQHFGVPQRRLRVFVVGCLGDGRRAAQVLFESTSGEWNPAASREAGTGVAACLRSRSAKPGVNGPGRGCEDDSNLVIPAARTVGTRRRYDPNGEEYVCGSLDTNTGHTDDNTAQAGHLIPTLHGHHQRSNHEDPIVTHTLRAEGADASEDGTGRGTPLVAVAFAQNQRNEIRDLNDMAGALAGQPGMKQQTFVAQPVVANGMTVRRLTPTECERLQGLPDGWTAGESDSTRYRMVGNGVAIPCIEWLGRRLIEATRRESTAGTA